MNLEDIIYLLLLFVTIGFGQIFRTLGQHKKIVSTLFGFMIIFSVSGAHTLYPILATVFTILILEYVPKRKVHKVSFIVLFLFLMFYRISHLLGLPMTPPHTNAIQMLLTLKLVGLCFEVHDTWSKKEKLKKETSQDEIDKLALELKYEEVDPSPLDVFHYAFCYIGSLTGPYFKYRTYCDMINAETCKQINFYEATLNRMKYVPFYSIMFILSGYFFPLSFAETEEIFRDFSFMYRVWYMTPIFFNFRMRIYAGFALSECACIMAGLGAYPVKCLNKPGKGPTNFKELEISSKKEKEELDFETIHNIDEYGSDFTPTVRGGMRCWNMTVQYWLANNVYKRLSLAKPLKEVITMFTSALWHGVHSGYYLSMLTVPFILAVEDFYERLIRRRLGEKGQRVYDWFTWFLKMQHFSYMGMAFLLLRIDTTLHYWKSIGFIYHGVIVLMHGLAQFVNLINSKVDKKLEKSRATSRIGDSSIRYKKLVSTTSEEQESQLKKQN